jgi:hypothetical protein
LGHLKTVMVLGFGYFSSRNPPSWRNLTGILIAMLGMFSYGFFKDRQTRPDKLALPKTSPVKENRPDADGDRGSYSHHHSSTAARRVL